jgi:purine-nucleoside phosphorylase
MSEPYSRALVEKAREISRRRPDIGRLAQGVYLATTGPSYETKAEIAFFRRIGADAVGMSTVPEVIVAAQEGMGVLGVSVIANMACGITKRQLSHAEVLSSVEKASRRVGELIRAVLEAI